VKKSYKELLTYINTFLSAPGNLGKQVPSLRMLSEDFGINHVTINRLIDSFVNQGILERQKRKGVYVKKIISSASSSGSTSLKKIFLLLPSASSFPEIIDAIKCEADKDGYEAVLAISNFDSETEQELIARFFSNIEGYDGGIFNIIYLDNLIQNRAFFAEQNRIVFLEQCPGKNFNAVMIDNYRGGTLAAEHFLAKKYSDFIFVGMQHPCHVNRQRLQGFKDTIVNSGNLLPDKNIIEWDSAYSSGINYRNAALISLLKQKKRFGIFAFNDLLAAQIYEHCEELGRNIGRDLGIIGFDNRDFIRYLKPKLVSLHINRAAIGVYAYRLLQDLKKNGNSVLFNPVVINLSPVLIPGKSV